MKLKWRRDRGGGNQINCPQLMAQSSRTTKLVVIALYLPLINIYDKTEENIEEKQRNLGFILYTQKHNLSIRGRDQNTH